MVGDIKDTKRIHGFTIVELLIVIVVIAILAAITVVAYNGVTNHAKQSIAQESAKQIYTKAMAFAIQNGDNYPVDITSLGFVDSASTRYEWSYDNNVTPRVFCASVTVRNVSYFISETVANPQPGLCSGHNGGLALSCPSGFIVVPGSTTYGTADFCVMKYEARDVGGVATSQPSGTPWISITQNDALTQAASACTGCHLITEAEWLTIAQNVIGVASNWSGGSVGSGYIYWGHADNSPASLIAASSNDLDGYSHTGNSSGSQRRTLTLSNGEVIWDFSGNAWEWTSGTVTTGQPGGNGYDWRQWNALPVIGSISPDPRPSYANAAAISWTTSNGIGFLYSNSSETALRSFRRGGYWNYNAGSGPFALDLVTTPTTTSVSTGFRVAR